VSIMKIRLIVGLGNPGEKFALTRHNAGAWFTDKLCQRYNIKMQPLPDIEAVSGDGKIEGTIFTCALTTSPINNCGAAVKSLMSSYDILPEQVLVAHDDLAILPGYVRFKFDNTRSQCLHNGVRDIVSNLNSTKFNRLRIGIGNPGIRAQVGKYVMSNPDDEEKRKIDDALEESINWMPDILTGNWYTVMNFLHKTQRPKFKPS
jgi:PTH1 family peptidyl-tRNA hydrolase